MPGGGSIKIAAAAAERRDRVRLSVADTGGGIPPELRERMFTLFATSKPHGTGVGLAVVRKIVERHGGTIAVEDVRPHGSRFVIDLPAAPAEVAT